LCYQDRYQDSQSNGYVFLSFSEVVCTKKLESKPIDDIEFQEDNGEVVVFSNFCENQSFEFAFSYFMISSFIVN
jgi:hypothetical protein